MYICSNTPLRSGNLNFILPGSKLCSIRVSKIDLGDWSSVSRSQSPRNVAEAGDCKIVVSYITYIYSGIAKSTPLKFTLSSVL